MMQSNQFAGVNISCRPAADENVSPSGIHRAAPDSGPGPPCHRVAADLAGLRRNDSLGATWLIRSVLHLLLWPTGQDTEALLLQRFLIPVADRRPGD